MAKDIIPAGFTPSHEPLQHSLMPPSWQGGKVTSTEARALVSKLRRWSGQFNHPEARELSTALEDVERCFTRVWTEIDEALSMFSQASWFRERGRTAEADEAMRVGPSYLHRWQDRGGKIGNVG